MKFRVSTPEKVFHVEAAYFLVEDFGIYFKGKRTSETESSFDTVAFFPFHSLVGITEEVED